MSDALYGFKPKGKIVFVSRASSLTAMGARVNVFQSSHDLYYVCPESSRVEACIGERRLLSVGTLTESASTLSEALRLAERFVVWLQYCEKAAREPAIADQP